MTWYTGSSHQREGISPTKTNLGAGQEDCGQLSQPLPRESWQFKPKSRGKSQSNQVQDQGESDTKKWGKHVIQASERLLFLVSHLN